MREGKGGREREGGRKITRERARESECQSESERRYPSSPGNPLLVDFIEDIAHVVVFLECIP